MQYSSFLKAPGSICGENALICGESTYDAKVFLRQQTQQN
jgi:hypothetical protein